MIQIKRMTTQLRILLGIIIWLCGVVFDALLIPYFFILIYVGSILTFFEIIKWLRTKENRTRARATLGLDKMGDFFAFVKTAFDFSWRRVSVLWTMCSAFAMVLVFLGGLMKTSDAYKTAVNSIETDKDIIQRAGEIIQFTSMISGNISNHQTSKINIGVIGQKESFWVTAHVDPTDDGYVTTELEIEE
jgi:hypothetical protein